MKKKLSMLLGLLLAAVTSWAENSISVIAEIPQSGTGYIAIALDNDNICKGFEFVLSFPEGITFVSESASTGANVPDGLFNQTPRNGNREVKFDFAASLSGLIPAHAGTIITFAVTNSITPEPAVDAVLTGNISDIKIVNEESNRIDLTNSSFDITITDGRIVFDEAAATLPLYEVGGTVNVKMKRSLTGGKWNTIVLPFTLTADKAQAIFGNDVQLARFDGFTTTYPDGGNLTPQAITINFASYSLNALSPMTGGVPYLIKTSSSISEFTADGVKMVGSVTGQTKNDTNYPALEGTFTGSLVKTQVPDNGLFISNETFYYSTGATNIKAFRGWFDLTPVLGEETVLAARVTYAIDGTPTAIEGVKPADVTENGAVYTIGGQLVGVDVPKESLKKGIYIKNGKKHIVK